MALTFTKKLEMNVGNKKMSMYDITHDGSVTTVDASSIGMHYIDTCVAFAGTSADYPSMSGTLNGAYVTFAAALSSGAVTTLWAIGW